MTHSLKRFFILLATFSLLILSGCATTGNNAGSHPKDPAEGFNRAMFSVNEGADALVFKPLAQLYELVTPQFIRTGITNFFANISDVWTAFNNLLQGKVTDGASDIGRVFVNTTVGIGGLFDVASSEVFNIEKHDEDFGQTLGVWGVPDGPYLFIPFLGPRTTRDAGALIVDYQADPVFQIDNVPLRNSLSGIRMVNTRANLFRAEKLMDGAAIDKYDYLRNAYLKSRRYNVFDGNPPKEADEDWDGTELKSPKK